MGTLGSIVHTGIGKHHPFLCMRDLMDVQVNGGNIPFAIPSILVPFICILVKLKEEELIHLDPYMEMSTLTNQNHFVRAYHG